MRPLFALLITLASSSAIAAPDPTTVVTRPTLGEGEQLVGGQPAQRWISPTGHAVMIAPVWTKERVVIRAYWNDPKPRTQDVVTIPGPVVSAGDPYYTDHADGQLAIAISGNIGGPDKGFAYRMTFDGKRGFKVVKKASYAYGYNNNKSPDWLQGKFEISNTSRAHSFGSDVRFLKKTIKNHMPYKLSTVTRTEGSTTKPVEETVPFTDLVKKWEAAEQPPAVGFKTKCNAKDNCCTYDSKKLAAWQHLEKICFVDNKPGTLYFVLPK